MNDLRQWLEKAITAQASDVHLSCGAKPAMRVNGSLCYFSEELLTEEQIIKYLQEISSEKAQEVLQGVKAEAGRVFDEISRARVLIEYDTAFEWKGIARFRVNVFRQSRGLSMAIRLISYRIPTFDELKIPEIIQKLCDLENGLVLITGATGSGKTTTIASLLQHINETQPKHIITLEDPIEYVYTSQTSLVQQREISTHSESFSKALRAALREDPDVILVGELRDADTIRLALTAAETGHLVFATLHTRNAQSAIHRMISVFSGEEQELIRAMLSESLQAVIAQRLIKSGDKRIGLREIMLCTLAVRNLIRQHKIEQLYSVIQSNQAMGMQTFEQAKEKL